MGVVPLVKATFQVPEDVVRMIRDYAFFRGLTDMNEALTELVRTQHYFTAQVKEGGKVIIEKPDGALRQVDIRAKTSR